MTWAKTGNGQREGKEKRPMKVAVFASRPLICYARFNKENMNTQTQWHEVKSDADLPSAEKRYLFTIENKNGDRKVTLLNLRSSGLGKK
jgi:hypothetical protein